MTDSPHRSPRRTGFDTLALHAGQRPDPATGARATPIYQSAAFVFPDTDFAVGLFNIERAGHVYSRLSNPTNAVLEERISALEGGVGAIATASGQAAMHLTVATLLGAGDHIVASRSLYGGTHNLLEYTLPRFGIDTTFVDPRSPDAFDGAVRENTRLLFGEVLGNPGLEVLNIPKVAAVAHRHGLPLVVDATFATPYLCQPVALGADIVIHSATKFLSGHGIVIGGLVVDGAFSTGRLPASSQPSPNPTTASTAWCSPKSSGRRRFSPAPAGRVCATSAPAWRPPPPFTSCKAWRRCLCAWRGMWRTPAPWRTTWRRTTPWRR